VVDGFIATAAAVAADLIWAGLQALALLKVKAGACSLRSSLIGTALKETQKVTSVPLVVKNN
jgi:hypothetical protein